jgi:hypothetical protein
MADDDFPQEISEDEATRRAMSIDTDAMLKELESMTDIEEPPAPEPEAAEAPELGVDEHGNDLPLPPAKDPVPPGYIEFEGRTWPIDEVRALLQLNQRMRDDPDVATRVSGAIAPPPETEPKLPEWIDPEDRTAVGLWHETQAAKTRAEQAERRLTAKSEEERRAHVVDSFRSAVSQFRTKHPNLNDEQVAQIADMTGRANIIEGLERTEGSLAAAFDRGMEMTMWSTPDLRSLALADQSDTVPANDKAQARKQKSRRTDGRDAGRRAPVDG